MLLSKTRKHNASMAAAQTYEDWRDAALAHDNSSGAALWKDTEDSPHFGNKSIRRRLTQLLELRANQDSVGLLFALNEGIHGNMDGMGNARLYQKAKFGTKSLIEDYVDAIVNSLQYIAQPSVTDISFEDKIEFFRRAQHCFGRSAFMMSGSGNFLFFHLGVVKALWQQGVMPSIISGSSGGSIIGAIVCTHKDEDVEKNFDLDYFNDIQNSVSAEAKSSKGHRAYLRGLKVQKAIARIIPDLTFQEAYDLTGRQLNVSIAPAQQYQNSRLLNVIASPNVYIREAVRASCALPGVYPAVTLMAKGLNGERQPYLPDRKWVDGSLTNDLPAKRLARLYGVNHYIVSQANPLVTRFVANRAPRNQIVAAVTKASSATLKAWANANATILQKPFALFPRANHAKNVMLSVINQNFGGDINIIRPPVLWAPHKLLSDISRKDMEYLMKMGQQTSWPKLEMIRTQTRIGQVIDQILLEYEGQLVSHHETQTEKLTHDA